MSNQKEKFWELADPIVKKHGLEIFDIEMPRGQGCLRIFVTKKKKLQSNTEAESESGVDIGDCSKIAKEVLDLQSIEEFMPGNTILEVSSPGINRKLSRKEHFADAVGERVRLVIFGQENKKEVLRGIIKAFDGRELQFSEESKGQELVVPIEKVQEARIDFLFN